MERILKYSIDAAPTTLTLPVGSIPLAVNFQSRTLFMWVRVPPATKGYEDRVFYAQATGEPINCHVRNIFTLPPSIMGYYTDAITAKSVEIAKQTLNYTDDVAEIMGGLSKKEAIELLEKNGYKVQLDVPMYDFKYIGTAFTSNNAEVYHVLERITFVKS